MNIISQYLTNAHNTAYIVVGLFVLPDKLPLSSHSRSLTGAGFFFNERQGHEKPRTPETNRPA